MYVHHWFGPFHVITYDAIDRIMEPKKRTKQAKPKKGHTLWIISNH
jgi:hypothetical protein